MKTRIYKTAQNNNVPSADVLAAYIESLNIYLEDNPNTKSEYSRLIKNLPAPRQVKQDFSNEECKILYETVEYLWKHITGNTIVQESEILRSPETLSGNYWLIKNGIMLHGVNHYGIIKQNTSMICSLLNINGFALQEYLHSKPNKLVRFILDNGGVRLFINKNKELYAQMSSDTYGKWGRKKIKKLDFKKKIVKVIDFEIPYKGWSSGISIKL